MTPGAGIPGGVSVSGLGVLGMLKPRKNQLDRFRGQTRPPDPPVMDKGKNPFLPSPASLHSLHPNPFNPSPKSLPSLHPFRGKPALGIDLRHVSISSMEIQCSSTVGEKNKGKKPAGQGARKGRRQVPGRGDIQIIPGTACDRGSPGVKPFHLYTFRQNHARRV